MTRVLVVEDDLDIRDALVDALESEGFSVAAAADGRLALELLRRSDASTRPSVILLDLMMPHMDGFEFRAEQLQDPALAAIPVAVVTADGSPGDKAGLLAAAGYLRKPIRISALVDLLNRLSPAPP